MPKFDKDRRLSQPSIISDEAENVTKMIFRASSTTLVLGEISA